MREVGHAQAESGYHRRMSRLPRTLLLALLAFMTLPALALGATGDPRATSVLTLIEIGAALVILAVVLAAGRHARAHRRTRERVWLPPSWQEHR